QIAGAAGIGHTRWATHAAPTESNAHPHATERVAVVHNGIIENYRELREELELDGYAHDTETDTETVAHLTTRALAAGLSPFDAVRETLGRLEGAFALCFLFRGADDLLICARRGSPLAIGYGDGEMFVGSDALALAPLTQRICYLEEGDSAAVTRAGAQVFDAEGRPVEREVSEVAISGAAAEKGRYRHFMAKEMHEQPAVARNLLNAYVSSDGARAVAPGAGALTDLFDVAGLERMTMSACGTAFIACRVAEYWIERLSGLPVDCDIASEFRYREAPLPENGAAVFVSQSGETADTLAAMRHCRAQGQRAIAVVNVGTSSIAREADVALQTLAGPEIGVASTKAFTGQLMVLAALSLLVARGRGRLDAEKEAALLAELRRIPALMSEALRDEPAISTIAATLGAASDALYLGRGPMYPLALEGALKLKEITYIHAEGYAAGELKHGPIALIDEAMPVVVLAPPDALFEKTISNMQEVMARGGKVILISDAEGVAAARDGVTHAIAMPSVAPIWAPILYSLPVQLLAYHAALYKGTDVDQPRNLAKSVTVE
ncbi:MAG: glutamine--fructose-6-phosphate transaminase (isomerizing), partial [Pseudomonadota bacterium]